MTNSNIQELSLQELESLQGGVKGSCVSAVGGALGLFVWSLSVPLTGGVSLALAGAGAATTLVTIGNIINCLE